MSKFTPELIEKAKNAKSEEELLAMAKENGIEMTAEGAALYYKQLNPAFGELDDDLDNVAGGGCGSKSNSSSTSVYDPIPTNWKAVRIKAGCGGCGSNSGLSNNPSGENWEVQCVDCSKRITGSGKAAYWSKFEKYTGGSWDTYY